jgi:putative transposase
MFLANTKIKSVKTGYRSPWQNGVCERTVGIRRRELLDHIISFDKEHLQHLLSEYVNRYYNPTRTHQGKTCDRLRYCRRKNCPKL